MNSKQQAILARDMIDMIRDYSNNADVLEYLSSFAFALARGIEDESVVDWDGIAGICDQRYYSLTQSNPIELDSKLLDKYYKDLDKYLQSQIL